MCTRRAVIRLSHRGVACSLLALPSASAPGCSTGKSLAAGTSATLERLKRAEHDPAHRVLLKGGIVLSMDRQVGDFEGRRADPGKEDRLGRPKLAAPAHALMVNAAGMIVMPGFIDTHHHQFETLCAAFSPMVCSASLEILQALTRE